MEVTKEIAELIGDRKLIDFIAKLIQDRIDYEDFANHLHNENIKLKSRIKKLKKPS